MNQKVDLSVDLRDVLDSRVASMADTCKLPTPPAYTQIIGHYLNFLVYIYIVILLCCNYRRNIPASALSTFTCLWLLHLISHLISLSCSRICRTTIST